MWNAAGLGISAVLAIAAFARASRRAGHYDGAYGMTPSTHRRYAYAALALALAFALGLAWPPMPTVVLLGAAVLLAIFFLTSFLRGAEADD